MPSLCLIAVIERHAVPLPHSPLKIFSTWLLILSSISSPLFSYYYKVHGWPIPLSCISVVSISHLRWCTTFLIIHPHLWSYPDFWMTLNYTKSHQLFLVQDIAYMSLVLSTLSTMCPAQATAFFSGGIYVSIFADLLLIPTSTYLCITTIKPGDKRNSHEHKVHYTCSYNE